MFKFTITLCLMSLSISAYSTAVEVFLYAPNGKPLKGIVVSVEPLKMQTQLKNADPVRISQLNKAFKPYLSVIQRNQPVEFINQDDITHHIYSASREQRFSFKMRSGSTHSKVQFNTAGQISMGCNIHDWMSGYLLILDTPYFSKTDVNGKVSITLPETGQAKINLWHPQLTKHEKTEHEVELISKQLNKFSFQLTTPLKAIPKQESGEDFDFLDDY
jgi:plastocyanin